MEVSLNERNDMTKQTKTTKEVKTPKKSKNIKQGIMGIMQLIIVASVAYSSMVIILGTDGYIGKALIVPQALWAACTLIRHFTK